MFSIRDSSALTDLQVNFVVTNELEKLRKKPYRQVHRVFEIDLEVKRSISVLMIEGTRSILGRILDLNTYESR